MSQISDSHIEKAWNQVSEASSSPEGLSDLMNRFWESQPAIFDFVSEASASWEADARDLAFHAALVIWLSFSAATQVQAESLIQSYQANAEWLDQQRGDSILIQKKMSDYSRFSEPELMRYAVELIFEAHEDGLEIEPEEQQDLLLVLKTLIDSFGA